MARKNNTPTVSQYNYIVTNLLVAKASRGENITEDDIRSAVKTAEFTLSLIYELTDIEPDESCMVNTEITDHFADYPWNGEATYTELVKWLHQKGITSNRKISAILHEALDNGTIIRDNYTRKYRPSR